MSLIRFQLFSFSCSESLYEDEEFDQRQLAALVVSKVLCFDIFYISMKTSFFFILMLKFVLYHLGILLPGRVK